MSPASHGLATQMLRRRPQASPVCNICSGEQCWRECGGASLRRGALGKGKGSKPNRKDWDIKVILPLFTSVDLAPLQGSGERRQSLPWCSWVPEGED